MIYGRCIIKLIFVHIVEIVKGFRGVASSLHSQHRGVLQGINWIFFKKCLGIFSLFWLQEKWGNVFLLVEALSLCFEARLVNVFCSAFRIGFIFCPNLWMCREYNGAEDAFFSIQFSLLFLLYFRLRALSSGGSVTSPPLSPALPKYKLADYRYGREEMLALFLKDNKVSRKRKKAWCVYVHRLVIRDSYVYFVIMDTEIVYPLAKNWRGLIFCGHVLVWSSLTAFIVFNSFCHFRVANSCIPWGKKVLFICAATGGWRLKSLCSHSDCLVSVGFHLT